MSYMVDQALKRPRDYNKLPPSEQWAIDRRLGILDWDPTKAEQEEFTQRFLEREAAEKEAKGEDPS